MALQLPVGIEALADLDAERSAAVHLAVGDAAIGRSALGIPGVAGLADQGTLPILLLVALELTVLVMAVGDLLVGGGTAKLVLLQRHPGCCVVGVASGVAAGVGALGELAGRVVGVLDGSAQWSCLFRELIAFVVLELVRVALGVREAGELIVRVPALFGLSAQSVGGLGQSAECVVLVQGAVAGRVGGAFEQISASHTSMSQSGDRHCSKNEQLGRL